MTTLRDAMLALAPGGLVELERTASKLGEPDVVTLTVRVRVGVCELSGSWSIDVDMLEAIRPDPLAQALPLLLARLRRRLATATCWWAHVALFDRGEDLKCAEFTRDPGPQPECVTHEEVRRAIVASWIGPAPTLPGSQLKPEHVGADACGA